MKFKPKVATVEKLRKVLIHLGEASIIGGAATLFVEGLIRWAATLVGVSGGIFMVF